MDHHRAGRLAQAETLYRQILQIAPGHVDALYLLSVLSCQAGQYAFAVELADKAILGNPNIAELHASRGIALCGLKRYREARESFDHAILHKPDFAEAYSNRGSALNELRQYRAALEDFDKAIQLNPNYAEAYSNRGNALTGLEQHQAALESFDKAIRLRPDFAEAHCNRGNALYALRQYREAVASFDQAIRLKPDYIEAYSNRGSTLNELQQFQAALGDFDRAIQLQPNYAEAHSNRANALHGLRQYPAAIASCDRALEINPNLAETWNNRGNPYQALQQYREAEQDFNRCIRLKPEFADAWNNLGTVLYDMQQYQAALEALDRAILLKPALAQAYSNRGNVLQYLQQYPLALENFTQAMRLDPDCDYVGGMRLHMKRFLCDWENLDEESRQLEARLDRNEKAAIPFPTLAIGNFPAVQKKAAEIYVRDRYPVPANAAPVPRRPQRDKIRIGYYSADFREHAVCYLMIDLFERHDRGKFEIVGFSFGPNLNDEMTGRVSAAMDRFVDIRSLSDREVVDLSRNLEVDIAVDLTGLTEHNRAGIFAARAAPIQVNYLGYPGTMGADTIDYLIADATLVPQASQPHYTEKIVYLPDSFQANSRHPISQKQSTRSQQGLPEQGFIFCCFNNSYKISPSTFAVWMRVLQRVEGSVLWLLGGNPLTEANLRKQAAQRGIAPERLVFAQRLPLAEHLGRQRLADLFLDTLPFNAGATASPALWAGLPVLTCMGETFAGRMGASLLRAIDLPELITTNQQDYEALAIELALNPERLRQLREGLERNRLTTPLFDTARFTRNLEAAYSAMLQRYHAGLPPGHIHVPPSANEPLYLPVVKPPSAKSAEQSSLPPSPASASASVDCQFLDLQLQQARSYHQAGQLAQAETIYRQILQLNPNHVDALYLLSVIAHQLGQYATAVELAGKAILANPNIAEFHAIRGNALAGLQQYSEALNSFDNAIRLKPDFVEAHRDRGNMLYALQRYREAVESFDHTIRLQPGFAGAHSNRGIALNALGLYQAAIESFDQAILLQPAFPEAHHSRGVALYKLRRFQAALDSLDQAILHRPDYAEAYSVRGSTLNELHQDQAAIESFDQAIQLEPGDAEAHGNRANPLIGLRQYQAALESIDRAILLQPDVAEAYSNRGNVLQILGQYPQALENFTRALQLDPDCDYVGGARLHLKRFLCDWENLEAEYRQVEAHIDRNQKAATPFLTLALSSPALQKKAAEIYVRDRYPAPADAAPIPRRPQRDKIRIGYFSADFHQHAVPVHMIDLFERHDRSKFEIIGFSFGPDIEDEMTHRVSAAMDRFLDVRSLSDREVVELSRKLEVDIAVDLMGFTEHFRLGIFAQRAAPIQVNYLGYPGTVGADTIDYLIADATLVPEASQPHYTEKIVYLPDSFQANSRHPISQKQFTRSEQGLPEQGFIFCCFNHSYKISPSTFAVWMRILERVEGSVLWLLAGNPLTEANLRKEAAQRGIAPERLIFAQRLPLSEHFSRQRLAGLFLDTLPFNAGATASPALWAGLPVLTCMGDTFAGRMGASLLRAMSLPESTLAELIATSEQAYENLAIELALDPARLQNIRDQLARNRLSAPLFDTARFTRNLEAAYSAMLQRYHAGLPPGHIHI
jgi:predicted O-linked N-acetylglucosamine transferase (SPINDLY family)